MWETKDWIIRSVILHNGNAPSHLRAHSCPPEGSLKFGMALSPSAFYSFTCMNMCDRSVTQSCPTLWDPVDCSTPGFPVHQRLMELGQTHVHPTICPLSYPSPPTFNLSQHQMEYGRKKAIRLQMSWFSGTLHSMLFLEIHSDISLCLCHLSFSTKEQQQRGRGREGRWREKERVSEFGALVFYKPLWY